jgi:arylsulfatase A-like enzyme
MYLKNNISFFVILFFLVASASASEQMNIVLILVDDLGWSDLACYGSDLHETPNVDQLADQGIHFTDAYAASSVCTPSRAALMTGEHPARLHMTVWSEAAKNPPLDKKVIPPVTKANLALEKITLAERLKEAGYLTAHIGKWHLGNARYYAQAQGFDVSIGGTHWGCPTTFFYPYRGMMHGDFRYVPGLGLGNEGDYLPDKLTDEAINLIESELMNPFFLYMSYYTVHTPIEAPLEQVAYFEDKVRQGMKHTNATYAAMVKNMDQNVGRILKSLERKGIENQTIVIFASDNGGFNIPWRHFPVITNNAPLRSGKGSLYEGGVRVPLIIRWPEITEAGSVSHEPVTLTDLFSTLIAAAGLTPAAGDSHPDGMNLLPVLKNSEASLPRNALYWHYPHYYPTTTPVSSIRAGDWKLLEYLEDNRLELYNLNSDPGEKINLADAKIEMTEKLRKKLSDWRLSVKAQMPTQK